MTSSIKKAQYSSPACHKKKNENLEENLRGHRLIEKLGEAHSMGRSKEHIQTRIVKVDRESMQFMKHAAKKCGKLKSGCICYSPESVIWIRREQIYKSLVGYHLGQNKNRGNLKRAVRKQGIKNPFQIWYS